MRGIFLIWRKMNINVEHGYIPHYWSRQDINDAKRALEWLGDFFDWTVSLKEEKEGAKDEEGDV